MSCTRCCNTHCYKKVQRVVRDAATHIFVLGQGLGRMNTLDCMTNQVLEKNGGWCSWLCIKQNK